MASKSKRARQAAAKAKTKSAWPVILWALAAAFAGYLQNRYGQFSDIRGFYGMRFMDGQHHWPYDSYIPAGASSTLNPIEYPAITGIVVWLLTFFVPKSGNPIFSYFAINAFVNAMLFAGTAYFVRKMTDNKHAYFYLFAPAVVMALNLNWDLWAMVPMLAAIYYFDRKKLHLSAVLLGLSIAAKFFPVVLLLPITIFLLRNREIRSLGKYLPICLFSWLAFNLPVLIASPEGWKYFYTFSFSRGQGDGSIYSIIGKLGLGQIYSNPLYYTLNIGIFGLLVIFLVKNKTNIPLTHTAFFTMFCFTYFGKQYSMQYILWLAPLAVITLRNIEKSAERINLLAIFCIWQFFEICFRLTYFENMLTHVYQGKPEASYHTISDQLYGYVGIIRYLTAIFFVALCSVAILKNKKV